ncbi:hypothetical protein [Clostridium ljungdahlii]|uniref:Uncharacterized protein n=1 Tax=Clostridium ljungdahlii TaxID=1538 RepID=A0A162KSY8_9CLOT|nr:hypothetical protein [Clostridium ljungdahlii]OAA83556.1 hypothetical protein WY13_03343 [Clostridium ljungdahlii]
MFENEGNLEMRLEKNGTIKKMGDTNSNSNMLSVEKNQINTNGHSKDHISVYHNQNCNLEDIATEKIYSNLAEAQENFIAPVDKGFLEDDILDSDILSEIAKAKASGAFVRTKHLTLIYGNEETTKIFAKRVVRNGNRGEPVIVFVYKDGESSSELEISKAELIRLSLGNYGEKAEGVNKKDVSYAETLLKKIGDRILPYWEFDIEITLIDLLKILSKNISKLKIDRGDELDITMVYSCIYKYVQKLKTYPNKCYLIRKGFYALTREDMLEVASSLESNIPDLIKILKQNNLLYLQNSSIGNQCEVKGVGSCYCVKMLAKYQTEEVEAIDENIIDEL